jgi:hypothetical protein
MQSQYGISGLSEKKGISKISRNCLEFQEFFAASKSIINPPVFKLSLNFGKSFFPSAFQLSQFQLSRNSLVPAPQVPTPVIPVFIFFLQLCLLATPAGGSFRFFFFRIFNFKHFIQKYNIHLKIKGQQLTLY